MNETLEMIQNYAASGKYKRVPVSRELYADAFTPISVCLLYTSPSPRDGLLSRMPSSA